MDREQRTGFHTNYKFVQLLMHNPYYQHPEFRGVIALPLNPRKEPVVLLVLACAIPSPLKDMDPEEMTIEPIGGLPPMLMSNN
jgi:hypothetical protein